MSKRIRNLSHRHNQQGALLILTLVILLVVSMLGMSTIDTSGLEMKMSSNSRTQQLAFEAAEYTLSWVENDIAVAGYFSPASITNVGCTAICFSPACSNGYCFGGANPEHWDNCTVGSGDEPYEDGALWADGSGKYKLLDIPNSDVVAKYIVEFGCYTRLSSASEKSEFNFTPMYRITAYTVSEGGKARAMLRSTIREI